jgi:hypothetical protein
MLEGDSSPVVVEAASEGQEMPMNPLERTLRQLLGEMRWMETMVRGKPIKVGDPNLSGTKLDEAIKWAQGRLGVLRADLAADKK